MKNIYTAIRSSNKKQYKQYAECDKYDDYIYDIIKHLKYSIKYNYKFSVYLLETHYEQEVNSSSSVYDGYLLEDYLFNSLVRRCLRFKNYKFLQYLKDHYVNGHWNDNVVDPQKYYIRNYLYYNLNIKYYDYNIHNLIYLYLTYDIYKNYKN